MSLPTLKTNRKKLSTCAVVLGILLLFEIGPTNSSVSDDGLLLPDDDPQDIASSTEVVIGPLRNIESPKLVPSHPFFAHSDLNLFYSSQNPFKILESGIEKNKKFTGIPKHFRSSFRGRRDAILSAGASKLKRSAIEWDFEANERDDEDATVTVSPDPDLTEVKPSTKKKDSPKDGNDGKDEMASSSPNILTSTEKYAIIASTKAMEIEKTGTVIPKSADLGSRSLTTGTNNTLAQEMAVDLQAAASNDTVNNSEQNKHVNHSSPEPQNLNLTNVSGKLSISQELLPLNSSVIDAAATENITLEILNDASNNGSSESAGFEEVNSQNDSFPSNLSISNSLASSLFSLSFGRNGSGNRGLIADRWSVKRNRKAELKLKARTIWQVVTTTASTTQKPTMTTKPPKPEAPPIDPASVQINSRSMHYHENNNETDHDESGEEAPDVHEGPHSSRSMSASNPLNFNMTKTGQIRSLAARDALNFDLTKQGHEHQTKHIEWDFMPHFDDPRDTKHSNGTVDHHLHLNLTNNNNSNLEDLDLNSLIGQLSHEFHLSFNNITHLDGTDTQNGTNFSENKNGSDTETDEITFTGKSSKNYEGPTFSSSKWKKKYISKTKKIQMIHTEDQIAGMEGGSQNLTGKVDTNLDQTKKGGEDDNLEIPPETDLLHLFRKKIQDAVTGLDNETQSIQIETPESEREEFIEIEVENDGHMRITKNETKLKNAKATGKNFKNKKQSTIKNGTKSNFVVIHKTGFNRKKTAKSETVNNSSIINLEEGGISKLKTKLDNLVSEIANSSSEKKANDQQLENTTGTGLSELKMQIQNISVQNITDNLRSKTKTEITETKTTETEDEFSKRKNKKTKSDNSENNDGNGLSILKTVIKNVILENVPPTIVSNNETAKTNNSGNTAPDSILQKLQTQIKTEILENITDESVFKSKRKKAKTEDLEESATESIIEKLKAKIKIDVIENLKLKKVKSKADNLENEAITKSLIEKLKTKIKPDIIEKENITDEELSKRKKAKSKIDATENAGTESIIEKLKTKIKSDIFENIANENVSKRKKVIPETDGSDSTAETFIQKLKTKITTQTVENIAEEDLSKRKKSFKTDDSESTTTENVIQKLKVKIKTEVLENISENADVSKGKNVNPETDSEAEIYIKKLKTKIKTQTVENIADQDLSKRKKSKTDDSESTTTENIIQKLKMKIKTEVLENISENEDVTKRKKSKLKNDTTENNATQSIIEKLKSKMKADIFENINTNEDLTKRTKSKTDEIDNTATESIIQKLKTKIKTDIVENLNDEEIVKRKKVKSKSDDLENTATESIVDRLTAKIKNGILENVTDEEPSKRKNLKSKIDNTENTEAETIIKKLKTKIKTDILENIADESQPKPKNVNPVTDGSDSESTAESYIQKLKTKIKTEIVQNVTDENVSKRKKAKPKTDDSENTATESIIEKLKVKIKNNVLDSIADADLSKPEKPKIVDPENAVTSESIIDKLKTKIRTEISDTITDQNVSKSKRKKGKRVKPKTNNSENTGTESTIEKLKIKIKNDILENITDVDLSKRKKSKTDDVSNSAAETFIDKIKTKIRTEILENVTDEKVSKRKKVKPKTDDSENTVTESTIEKLKNKIKNDILENITDADPSQRTKSNIDDSANPETESLIEKIKTKIRTGISENITEESPSKPNKVKSETDDSESQTTENSSEKIKTKIKIEISHNMPPSHHGKRKKNKPKHTNPKHKTHHGHSKDHSENSKDAVNNIAKKLKQELAKHGRKAHNTVKKTDLTNGTRRSKTKNGPTQTNIEEPSIAEEPKKEQDIFSTVADTLKKEIIKHSKPEPADEKSKPDIRKFVSSSKLEEAEAFKKILDENKGTASQEQSEESKTENQNKIIKKGLESESKSECDCSLKNSLKNSPENGHLKHHISENSIEDATSRRHIHNLHSKNRQSQVQIENGNLPKNHQILVDVYETSRHTTYSRPENENEIENYHNKYHLENEVAAENGYLSRKHLENQNQFTDTFKEDAKNVKNIGPLEPDQEVDEGKLRRHRLTSENEIEIDKSSLHKRYQFQNAPGGGYPQNIIVNHHYYNPQPYPPPVYYGYAPQPYYYPAYGHPPYQYHGYPAPTNHFYAENVDEGNLNRKRILNPEFQPPKQSPTNMGLQQKFHKTYHKYKSSAVSGPSNPNHNPQGQLGDLGNLPSHAWNTKTVTRYTSHKANDGEIEKNIAHEMPPMNSKSLLVDDDDEPPAKPTTKIKKQKKRKSNDENNAEIPGQESDSKNVAKSNSGIGNRANVNRTDGAALGMSIIDEISSNLKRMTDTEFGGM